MDASDHAAARCLRPDAAPPALSLRRLWTIYKKILAIYTHAMRRTRDDSAGKIAELAGLPDLGNKRGNKDSVECEESELSDCFIGSPG